MYTEALKFDLQAFGQGDHRGERCIRNFVARDTLVVVTATIDGSKGDGMVVNMHVSWIPNCHVRVLENVFLTAQCRSRML